MRFLTSFSAGKDSMLALHKTLAMGHTCAGLLVMYNEDAGRSWFHGVEPALLYELAAALSLPLLPCPAMGDQYHSSMEECLREAKADGVDACVFGDIDTEEHRAWDEARCRAAGLTPLLPLWGMDREACVRETLELGYACLIKCINNTLLPERLLGQPLSLAMLEEFRTLGIDLCGENGEYHTLVVDGPLFRRPASHVRGEVIRLGRLSAIDIRAKGGAAL